MAGDLLESLKQLHVNEKIAEVQQAPGIQAPMVPPQLQVPQLQEQVPKDLGQLIVDHPPVVNEIIARAPSYIRQWEDRPQVLNSQAGTLPRVEHLGGILYVLDPQAGVPLPADLHVVLPKDPQLPGLVPTPFSSLFLTRLSREEYGDRASAELQLWVNYLAWLETSPNQTQTAMDLAQRQVAIYKRYLEYYPPGGGGTGGGGF